VVRPEAKDGSERNSDLFSGANCGKVEQKVLPGTLKRALQTRSWLVVFDGLDEVPHDVKDAVAVEVRHFVDDIVLESNADLLTLCTSRYQMSALSKIIN
jgi:hypothetical protein